MGEQSRSGRVSLEGDKSSTFIASKGNCFFLFTANCSSEIAIANSQMKNWTDLLKIYIFTVKPYFLEEPEDVTALNGQDIDLECEVGGDPNPTVLWHREDGTLPHGRTRIQGGKLSIQNVTPKDEGVYVCEAQNTVGTISVSATLSVHGKPFLWGAETYFTILFLCLVVLPCFFPVCIYSTLF